MTNSYSVDQPPNLSHNRLWTQSTSSVFHAAISVQIWETCHMSSDLDTSKRNEPHVNVHCRHQIISRIFTVSSSLADALSSSPQCRLVRDVGTNLSPEEASP